MIKKLFYFSSLLLLTLLLASPSNALAAENPETAEAVGSIIHIMGYATAAQPGKDERKLSLESPIYANDTVKTGRTGNLEIRFNDNSVFSQAKESQVVIDEFVWSADPSASKMLLKLGKGTFRYVTGKLVKANADGFSMKTPMATIGIRGTEVFATVEQEREVIGVLDMTLGHTVIVHTVDGIVTFTAPGQLTTIEPGKPATPPAPIPADMREKVIKIAPMTSQGELGKVGSTKELRSKVEGFKALVNAVKSDLQGLDRPVDYLQFRQIKSLEMGLVNAESERNGEIQAANRHANGSTDDGQSTQSHGGGYVPGGP